MKRPWALYAIDIGLLLSFLVVFVTGIVKWPGLVTKLGLSYQDLPMRTLTLFHDWAGLLLGMLSLVHVLLHWSWLVAMTKRLFSRDKSGRI